VLQVRSWLPRTEGSIRLELVHQQSTTCLAVLRQAGAARVRFPRVAAGAPLEAVLLNTAGGLTGGDRMDVAMGLARGTCATATTAAAEKIYRSREGDTAIDVGISLGPQAQLAWLPQPTILFDGARLSRCTRVDIAPDARFLAVECLVFGRQAMGETVRHGSCRDAWRIHREGRLIFADTFRAGGDLSASFSRPATLAGARAVAMLIYVSADAASRLESVRAMLDGRDCQAGASSWDGMLLVRALAADSRSLLRKVAPLLQELSGRPLPRVWQC
jgi:urease accessory protein